MTILGLARTAVLAGTLALISCVTVENPLSQNDVASMKLTDINVSFAPDAIIHWDDGSRAYAAANAIPDYQIGPAANTPEGRAYVQNLLAPQIKAGIERAMAGQLNGSRPVRLNVVVRSFTIASAVQRIVVGGHHGMVADANLVDARTGAEILSHPKLNAFVAGGQGVFGAAAEAAVNSMSTRSTLDKIVDQYGEGYRDWLLRRS